MGPEAGKLLEGEEPVSASEAELVDLLEAVVQVGAQGWAALHRGGVEAWGVWNRGLAAPAPPRRPLLSPSSPHPSTCMCSAPDASPVCREVGLTALAKLEPRLPGSSARIRALVAGYSHSAQLEVQTRSVEYSRLFGHAAIRPQVGQWEGSVGVHLQAPAAGPPHGAH